MTFESWMLATLLWLLAMLGVILLSGAVAGLLDNAYTVYGDSYPLRNRVAIASGMMVIGLAVVTGAIAPIWFAISPTSLHRGLMVAIALALGAVFYVKPVRALAYALAFGVVGSTALALPLGMAHSLFWVIPPRELLVWVWCIAFMTGAYTGLALGRGSWGPERKWQPFRWHQVFNASLRMSDSSAHSSRLLGLTSKPLGIAAAAGAAISTVMAITEWGNPWGPVLVLGVPFVMVVVVLPILSSALGLIAAKLLRFLVPALEISTAPRKGVRAATNDAMILTRFSRVLCDHCLRWSQPLLSGYQAGTRTCEYCNNAVSYGPSGRLIAVFVSSIGKSSAPGRTFLRRASEIASWSTVADVTDIAIPAGIDVSREVEELVVHLANHEPQDGMESVRVHAADRESLPIYLANLLTNHFTWSEVYPVDRPLSPTEQAKGRERLDGAVKFARERSGRLIAEIGALLEAAAPRSDQGEPKPEMLRSMGIGSVQTLLRSISSRMSGAITKTVVQGTNRTAPMESSRTGKRILEMGDDSPAAEHAEPHREAASPRSTPELSEAATAEADS